MDHLCTLCPRMCSVDRAIKKGFCALSEKALIAKVMLHKWEEPCICYGKGSGAVFFSGCQLGCVFCQNHEISSVPKGTGFSVSDLADLFLRLQELGACNVNLVSPTPHLKNVISALETARAKGLKLPIVFNSGGYERTETVKALDGLIDVYLPDFKFFSSLLSQRYANAPDYADVAVKAIEAMVRQVGPIQTNTDGTLLRGVIVRHLVLPGASGDSVDVLNTLFKAVSPRDVILSLMSQYVPMHKAKGIPPLNRAVTSLEYQKVVNYAKKFDCFDIYTQDRKSADESYVPDFSKPIDKAFLK